MNNIKNYILFLVLSATLSLTSCNSGSVNDTNPKPVDYQRQKETIEKANRYLVTKESEDINDYIERHELKVTKTGSGLCYSIINPGRGLQIERNEVISMKYEVRLLTGEVLYSSENEGVKTFAVGKGGVETGLEEAVINLHHGDVAEIIIPSHLAHGLLGDGNKVPPRTTLVYRIKIL